MQPWTRLQDWVTLLAGAYTVTSPVALSTIGMTGEGKVVVAMIALAALMAISSIVSLARPHLIAAEWATTGSADALTDTRSNAVGREALPQR